MEVRTLIEFVDAAFDTKWVSGPYEERGGIFLVGHPGALKTTILNAAIGERPDVISLSDLNVKQFMDMKDDFSSQRYSSMVFFDFEKIYQRHGAVSSNMEGIIKALVSEGFKTGPGGDQRAPGIKARALIVGAMTEDFLRRHYSEWSKSGFLRRFIWLTIAIENPDAITQAIDNWKKINFGKITSRPSLGIVQVQISKQRVRQLRHIMREQSGFQGTAYVLMKKIAAILEWRSNGKGNAVTHFLNAVSPALSKDGGMIKLEEE